MSHSSGEPERPLRTRMGDATFRDGLRKHHLTITIPITTARAIVICVWVMGPFLSVHKETPHAILAMRGNNQKTRPFPVACTSEKRVAAFCLTLQEWLKRKAVLINSNGFAFKGAIRAKVRHHAGTSFVIPILLYIAHLRTTAVTPARFVRALLLTKWRGETD